MTAFEHAEGHERLMDLTLEPEALRRLSSAVAEAHGQTDDPLVAHIISCATCRDVVASWERTHATVRRALAGGPGLAEPHLADLDDDERMLAPASVRTSVLEMAGRASREDGSPAPVTSPVAPLTSPGHGVVGGPPAGPSRRGIDLGRRLLALAAVIGIIAVAGGVVIDQSRRLEQAHRETAALEAVAATVDRVLRDPAHSVVDLRAADGTAAGSISWSSRDFVVLTGALQPPPAGRIYACWIERDGVRSPVGQMWFAGETAFWTGSLDDWATTSFGSGTFGISLEPVAGPRDNPALLIGDLGP